MEDLNNVPSSGTYGAAINEVNSNFSLVVNAINSLEYATTKSKGIYNNGFTPSTTTLPNSVDGDWCMVLGTGNTFPARIWTFNGTTWAQGGTWNPDGINLNDYATTTALNTAVANSLLQATARMGYGEATASNNAYSVTITGYTLPTIGGVVRVKMPTSATGAATLDITNTGAKTIWYNGLAVTSENTWGAGEVISVFYDGTKYMSSNFQGGGGSAVKIAYDNSQSGLAATDVQAAIDELNNDVTDLGEDLVEELDARTLKFQEAIDIDNSALYPNRTGFMVLSNGNWVFVTSGYSRLFRIIPRDAGKKYLKVTANNTATSTIAFSDTFQSSPSSLQAVAFCAGETACHNIPSGTSMVLRIPDACTYIFVNRYTQSTSGGTGTNSYPSAMIYGSTLDGAIDDITQDLNGSEVSGTRSNNLMLDDGSVSSSSGTANKYNVISYTIDATKKYKVRTHTRGNGIHAIVFKNGSTVTGLLYPFDNEDKAITLYLDSSNIPSGTTTVCVNGWIYDGDTITLSEIEAGSVAEMLKSCDNRKYLGKNILCLGDSITEYVNSGGVGYPDYLAELSGGNVTKIGIGGARLSQSTAYPTDGNFTSVAQCYGGALAISKLVEYIYTQNFTLCDQATEYLRSQGDDNRETIARLKTVDITKFDIVTIFGGTNDWTASAAVGDAGSTDVANISGSLYYMVTTLLTMNPKLKIVILTPIIRYYGGLTDAKWCETLLVNGITLTTVVEGIEAEAKTLHMPCLDLYYNLGWNKTNFSTFFMKNDNSGVDTTHPYHGFKELAEKIYAMMQTVI